MLPPSSTPVFLVRATGSRSLRQIVLRRRWGSQYHLLQHVVDARHGPRIRSMALTAFRACRPWTLSLVKRSFVVVAPHRPSSTTRLTTTTTSAIVSVLSRYGRWQHGSRCLSHLCVVEVRRHSAIVSGLVRHVTCRSSKRSALGHIGVPVPRVPINRHVLDSRSEAVRMSRL